jgi:periplasmic protein TonB
MPNQSGATHSRMHASTLVTLFLWFLPSLVWAEAKLNGVSVHTELGAEQFIAALYAETLSSDARVLLLDTSDQRMEVRVVASSLLANRFKRMWIEGVAINAGTGEMQKHAQHLADFSNMLTIKLQRDDVLSIRRKSNTTQILVNNIELGQIPSGEFYNLLLRTWIGPVPLSSAFRDGLLTAGKVDDKSLSIFNKINPTPERIAVIRNALIAAGKLKGKPIKPETPSTEVAATPPTETIKPETIKPEKPKQEPAKPPEVPAGGELATTAKPVETAKPADTLKPKPEPVKVEPAKPAAEPKPAVASAPNPASTGDIFEEEDKKETADSLLLQQLYISKLSKRTASFVKYPKSALSKDQQGTVRVSVTIDKSGQVTSVKTSAQTDYPLLNQAAVDAANRASPYPPIPDEMKVNSFTFTVPIAFRVQTK